MGCAKSRCACSEAYQTFVDGHWDGRLKGKAQRSQPSITSRANRKYEGQRDDEADRGQTDNPYQAWIDPYADEGFAEEVRKVIVIADQMAEAASSTLRDEMLRAYVRSAQPGLMFWDSACPL